MPGAEQVWGMDPAAKEVNAPTEALAEYIDPVGVHTLDGSPHLWVYGATPMVDGSLWKPFSTTTTRPASSRCSPAQISLRGGGQHDCGLVGTLPVRLRLPDDQGFLVAAEGSALSYRVGDGQWQDAGRDAALLPATATDVQVTDADGTATSVPVGA
ncbi:hypothetical protein NKG94_08965 [Micromonospora sp. M12]